MTVLTGDNRQTALAPLIAQGWTECTDRDAITKEFKFKNFASAFGWITSIAILAEKADHHPEWSNVYNRVAVTLTTHSAGGITDKDITLAGKMEDLA